MPKKRVSHEEGSGVPLTSEHMVYLQCWLKAQERGSVTFIRQTAKEVKALSYALYRTAKIILARPDLQAEFPQFRAARLDVSIRIEGNKLIMFRADKNPATQQIIRELGLTDADIRLPKMESIKQAEERISAALHEAPKDQKPELPSHESGLCVPVAGEAATLENLTARPEFPENSLGGLLQDMVEKD